MSRHAIIFLSSPSEPGKFANGLTYARQLDEAGHDVAVYFDGDATRLFTQLDDLPEPAAVAYEAARERDLVAGVCDHCSRFKGAKEAAEAAGFEIEGREHTPDVAALVEQGYDVTTI